MTAFYITTAIEYANGEPHLGHAFEKIGADTIARYRRLRGERAQLLVGTDDHGLKVARAAAVAGRTPAEQADQSSAAFRRAWDTLGIRYETFVRTTSPQHAAGVRALIDRIRERHPNAFYERAYEGWYCVGCESFRTTHDLVNGQCPVHPTLEVERVAESNWFFRLSAFQDFLAAFLGAHPGFVQPAVRRNEIVAFVARGLEDVSITRASLDWGIPFPLGDANGRHQAIYVWFDALPSYLTATGFPDTRSEITWPAQVHVIGKDITRFHCVLWPAVLHAAGLPLPERVWVHGFVTVDGARLSKTAGVWVELPDAIERYGPDALRYFLLREIPFDGDGDFSWARFDARYSADLANTLGNLVSRVVALVARHCEGSRVPGRRSAEIASELEARAAANLERYIAGFDAFRPHDAVAAIWDTLAAANEYVTRSAPWSLAADAGRRGELEAIFWTLLR
ncbi:MAG TPA: methionine--tRNA ligase, partial [Gemmatimonadaceae bacterium]|nr:methionine--tRNA ligase [Gemmatimonadaceae bacterium]